MSAEPDATDARQIPTDQFPFIKDTTRGASGSDGAANSRATLTDAKRMMAGKIPVSRNQAIIGKPQPLRDRPRSHAIGLVDMPGVSWIASGGCIISGV